MTVDLASLQSRDGARRVFAGQEGETVTEAGVFCTQDSTRTLCQNVDPTVPSV